MQLELEQTLAFACKLRGATRQQRALLQDVPEVDIDR